MEPLTRTDLYSLEEYSEIRNQFREQVMEHKEQRRLCIGEHATLYFEDRVTMQYQVQEMLRIERIFESKGIEEELAVYNPLIPDGHNWKATFMIEYADVEERRQALAKLIGIEKRLWVQVADFDRVYAIANEDLDRETEEKTSSVHFVRFELTPAMVEAVKSDSPVRAGIDHPAYQMEVLVEAPVYRSLQQDLS